MSLSREDVQRIADAVALRLRKPWLTISELAQERRCHPRTVRRALVKYDIPKRDRHGDIHDGGNHPILISRIEWEARTALPTRVVKNNAS